MVFILDSRIDMQNNLTQSTVRVSEENSKPELTAAFSDIVSVMSTFDAEERMRLFKLIVTYFDFRLPHDAPSITGHPLSAPQPSASLQPAMGPVFFSEDRSISPKQFLFDKRPQTDIERVTCLAFYATHYREMQHFKTLDLSKLNTEAAQIKLSNPNAAVDNAAQAGLLVQSGQGRKQISALGELYVQALPDRNAAKEAVAKARPRKLRVRAKTSMSKKR